MSAVYSTSNAGRLGATVALLGALGIAALLLALLAVWDDGLVAGPALLLVAYTASLVYVGAPLDRSAPLVGAGLIACVELGSWSLELRDGAEERPVRRLGSLVLLLFLALAASTVVFGMGSASTGAGLALWLVGAAAATALIVLIAMPARTDRE